MVNIETSGFKSESREKQLSVTMYLSHLDYIIEAEPRVLAGIERAYPMLSSRRLEFQPLGKDTNLSLLVAPIPSVSSHSPKRSTAHAVALINSNSHPRKITGKISNHSALRHHRSEIVATFILRSCQDSRGGKWTETPFCIECASAARRICVGGVAAKISVRVRLGDGRATINCGGGPDGRERKEDGDKSEGEGASLGECDIREVFENCKDG